MTKTRAFTLRLDSNRHKMLRAAVAVRNKSAQNLVVEALDAFFSANPEFERIAAQLPEQ